MVALLASAGGLDPLPIVLRDLPKDFPAAGEVEAAGIAQITQ